MKTFFLFVAIFIAWHWVAGLTDYQCMFLCLGDGNSYGYCYLECRK